MSEASLYDAMIGSIHFVEKTWESIENYVPEKIKKGFDRHYYLIIDNLYDSTEEYLKTGDTDKFSKNLKEFIDLIESIAARESKQSLREVVNLNKEIRLKIKLFEVMIKHSVG